MIRTIFFFFTVGLLAVLLLPAALYARYIAKDGRAVVEYLLGKLWWIVLGAAGVTYETRGLENLPEGPALYVGNHQSIFDIFVILVGMGPAKGFIAKKELSKIPIAHLWLEALGCIYIDRGDLRASLATMKQAEEKLKNGQSMIVFPEGTRSRGPEMGEFKHGAIRCALKAGVPIVPFALDNCYKAYEETGRITPTHIKISILPPVATDAPGLKTPELCDELRSQIAAELEELRREE